MKRKETSPGPRKKLTPRAQNIVKRGSPRRFRSCRRFILLAVLIKGRISDARDSSLFRISSQVETRMEKTRERSAVGGHFLERGARRSSLSQPVARQTPTADEHASLIAAAKGIANFCDAQRALKPTFIVVKLDDHN